MVHKGLEQVGFDPDGIAGSWRSQNKIVHVTRLHQILQVLRSLLTVTLYSEKAVASYSSTPAWKIPWVEEPGGLQSMGLQRVGHT